MNRKTKIIMLSILSSIFSSVSVLNQKERNVYATSGKTSGLPYFTVINEDGSVESIPYEKMQITYYFSPASEENENNINETLSASIDDITYGVARIKGYTSYKEYDGTTDKIQRSGYVHGTSANDAAFICTLNNGNTVRVKQAGIYMDIPAENVEVKEYTKEHNVSYYQGKEGKLYHYYYYGSYGGVSKKASTIVGYTPDYLKNGVRYYSYDGHYFYTDYKKMINDYKSGVNIFENSVNKDTPYYNYYQYLSFRAPTTFSATKINEYVNKMTSSQSNSKLKNQGEAFLNTEKMYGINAVLMLGVAINESAWGTSYYAVNRNNLFGLGAVDSNPDQAYDFETIEDCLFYFSSRTLSDGYLDGGDYRYRGPHLGDKQSGINVYYASDPYWGEKAASFSYSMNNQNKECDYLKYKIAMSLNGNVGYFKDEQLKTAIYSSGASVNSKTNLLVHNVPFTVIEESDNTYKIFSDTVLKDNRNGLNASSGASYNILRDYVYINKKDCQLIYEFQEKEPEYLPGDVNADNKISSVDYVKIKNHIMKVSVLDESHIKRADVNKDGQITSVDYVKIKNHIMGKSKLF